MYVRKDVCTYMYIRICCVCMMCYIHMYVRATPCMEAGYWSISAVLGSLHLLSPPPSCVCCRLVHSSPLMMRREPSSPSPSMLEESFGAIMDEVCGLPHVWTYRQLQME